MHMKPANPLEIRGLICGRMGRRPGGKGQQKPENDEEKEYCLSLVGERGR